MRACPPSGSTSHRSFATTPSGSPRPVSNRSWTLSSLRWTVDHADDLAMVRELLAGFTLAQAVEADRFDLLRVLDRHPALADMNRHTRNEGYAKSLRQDPAARPSEGTP